MAALAVQILGLGLGLAGWRLGWVDTPVASPAGMVESGWQCAAAAAVVETLGLVPGLPLVVRMVRLEWSSRWSWLVSFLICWYR